MNYILKNGRVVDPSRQIDSKMDIGIKDGKICEPENTGKAKIVDLKGLVVTPGLIDLHVHLRQPGRNDKETIETGTKAAAAGGFTTIVAMPNTSPCADTPGTIEYIKLLSEREGLVNVLPCAAISKGQEGKEMSSIGSLKKAGAVALSDDGKCVQNHEIMRHVMEYSRSFKIPILDHCEDEILSAGGIMHDGRWSVLLGICGQTAASEELMVARDIILSEHTGCPIHIQHVSSKGTVRILRNAQREKIPVTAEITPHHISLTDESLKSFNSNLKVNPPLRSEEDRLELIEGLKDGTITVIASDHAPHTETEKLVELDNAPFGIIGIETEMSICFEELYHSGILSLTELISKWTVGPATVLGISAGTLKLGAIADITIINPDKSHVIDKNKFFSKARNTPFHGRKVRGQALVTIVGGRIVFSRIPSLKGLF
jgi:dihydroorotase